MISSIDTDESPVIGLLDNEATESLNLRSFILPTAYCLLPSFLSFYICHSTVFLIVINLERRSNMKLYTNKELLILSKKGGYAVGAFNINNLEILQAADGPIQDEAFWEFRESGLKPLGRWNDGIMEYWGCA
jgi:hypothetical protein